jgi:ribosomal-protein-alanine N-acetyltransferase
MSEALRIEAAAEADLPELRRLADECGLHVDFEAELKRSYGVLRVARREREVLGFLLAWRAADELHLTDLGVTASARRQGIGAALVRALCTEDRESARVVLLEVRASNVAALALYDSLGFVELDRRARYYADTGEDAVVMQLVLR